MEEGIDGGVDVGSVGEGGPDEGLADVVVGREEDEGDVAMGAIQNVGDVGDVRGISREQ